MYVYIKFCKLFLLCFSLSYLPFNIREISMTPGFTSSNKGQKGLLYVISSSNRKTSFEDVSSDFIK